MKVYLCYECYYDAFGDYKISVVKVVDSEAKATQWVDDFKPAISTVHVCFVERDVE